MRLLVKSKAQDARAKARLAYYEDSATRLRRLWAVSVANTDILVERRAVEASLLRTRNAMLDSIVASLIRDNNVPLVERNFNLVIGTNILSL